METVTLIHLFPLVLPAASVPVDAGIISDYDEGIATNAIWLEAP
jgi:hypothetical protein